MSRGFIRTRRFAPGAVRRRLDDSTRSPLTIVSCAARRATPLTRCTLVESTRMAFVDYFRCPSQFAADRRRPADLSAEEGYFAFDERDLLRAPQRRAAGAVRRRGARRRLGATRRARASRLRLPFDLSEVVTNLRQERYRQRPHTLSRADHGRASGSRSLYYFLRPLLPVGVRKHLQKIRLSGWERIALPALARRRHRRDADGAA